MADAAATHVVKLGGSLLDLPDLLPRLEAWRQAEAGPRLVLVVGGGEAADVVRAFDRTFALGAEPSHWLAIRAMQLNAHLIAGLLPRVRLVANAGACPAAWATGEAALVDPLAWLEDEHLRGVRIPHRWTFTSDSIAAHLAGQVRAERLTLLKSTLPPAAADAAEAARLGIVDADFPAACPANLRVELVNLRTLPPQRRVLSGQS